MKEGKRENERVGNASQTAVPGEGDSPVTAGDMQHRQTAAARLHQVQDKGCLLVNTPQAILRIDTRRQEEAERNLLEDITIQTQISELEQHGLTTYRPKWSGPPLVNHS